MFSPKQLDTVLFKQPKNFRFWGTSSPDTLLLSVSLQQNLNFPHLNRFLHECEHMFSNHVFNYFFWLQLICTKKAWITTLSAIKGFSFWGTSSSVRPPTIFYCSAKLNNFQKSNIQYGFVRECGQLNMFSNHEVVYFKRSPQICTMNGFKFDFSQIFCGGAHRGHAIAYNNYIVYFSSSSLDSLIDPEKVYPWYFRKIWPGRQNSRVYTVYPSYHAMVWFWVCCCQAKSQDVRKTVPSYE